MAVAFQTITKDELKGKMDRGEPVQIVNVLSPKSYLLGLIKGSLKIPVDELDQRSGELDRSKEVVTYCAGYQCTASREAAEKLAAKGFNVRAYEGGITEWKEAGLPLEPQEGVLKEKATVGSEKPATDVRGKTRHQKPVLHTSGGQGRL
jgi:rhodanese-related sulfurtransferase